MGLLEQAQKRKKKIEQGKNTEIKVEERQTKEKIQNKEEPKKIIIQKDLLKKSEKKKEKVQNETTKETKEEKKPTKEKTQEKKEISEQKNLLKKTKEKIEEKPKIKEPEISTKDYKLIEEKTGFGYKGMGTRRILYNDDKKEYLYHVTEPELNKQEKEIKNELTHLFKMLADVNVSNMTKEEKKDFLEETLEQIITDNNIDFLREEKTDEEEKEGKKGIKELFSVFSRKNKKNEKDKITDEERTKKEKEIKEKIYYHLFRDFLGYGEIDIIMEDNGIEDVSCDGQDVPIFIYHKKYDEISSNVVFENEEKLNSFVVRLAQITGKQISVYSPIVDGKLPDGSRLQTTLARTVTQSSTFTIRKFKENPLTPIDLIKYQSISPEMAAYFWMAIERGASILFCGGTASGKTTALNALSLFIPGSHKIVSIEDTREVNLPHKNWIAGTTRQGFSASDEKTGKDIDMFDLIRAALRQRPKVIMVGEVRGKEAYSLFQAMSTGHTSYATVHASDIHTLIQRLENPPISLPRALLTSLDIIIFQNAIDIKDKTVRRMTSVTEIVKLDPDTNQLIFMEPYKWVSKTDDRFEASGSSKILNNIRIQNDWTEIELCEELEKRMLILRWMIEKDITDYKEVGKIVNLYNKYPDDLLEKAREETKK